MDAVDVLNERIDSLVNAVAARDQALDALESKLYDMRALADDLYARFTNLRELIRRSIATTNLADDPEDEAVLARYREARQR
jgi:hypothetical protein